MTAVPSQPPDLRAFVTIDKLQPQFASFVGAVTEGSLPTAGMASLYVEIAPGNWVFPMVNIAVKAARVYPGAQVVEREFGLFEVHAETLEEVKHAGHAVLDRTGLRMEDADRPQIASVQVVSNIDPYQAQLLNRFRRGMMIVPGESLLVMECTPAAYINLALNEAEKSASVNVMHCRAVGVFGRLWVAGNEANVLAARDAAVSALSLIAGSAQQV